MVHSLQEKIALIKKRHHKEGTPKQVEHKLPTVLLTVDYRLNRETEQSCADAPRNITHLIHQKEHFCTVERYRGLTYTAVTLHVNEECLLRIMLMDKGSGSLMSSLPVTNFNF